jgi:hypothetical protein
VKNIPLFNSTAKIFFIILLAMAPVSSGAQDKPENGPLDLQELEDVRSAELVAARKPLRDADATYRAELEKYEKSSQADGNLKAVLAAKQAIEDLDIGKPVEPSGDTGLTKIQNAYAVKRGKADAACAKAIAKVDRIHIESLKKLVANLTKDNQIERAMGVQEKIDQLVASLNQNDRAEDPAAGASGIEEWKMKALSEFPELNNPNSDLSLRVKKLRHEKASVPGYFSNPQWPYLLAKEAEGTKQEQTAAVPEIHKMNENGASGKKYGPVRIVLASDPSSGMDASARSPVRLGAQVSQLRLVRGLAGSGTVSLTMDGERDLFIRHSYMKIVLAEKPKEGSQDLFMKDASFKMIEVKPGAFQFETSNLREVYFLSVDAAGVFVIAKITDPQRATFALVRE